jgi:hypothetical protein
VIAAAPWSPWDWWQPPAIVEPVATLAEGADGPPPACVYCGAPIFAGDRQVHVASGRAHLKCWQDAVKGGSR